MTVWLMWSTDPRHKLVGIFSTLELAQEWYDEQFRSGLLVANGHDYFHIEPHRVIDS